MLGQLSESKQLPFLLKAEHVEHVLVCSPRPRSRVRDLRFTLTPLVRFL